MYTIKLLVLRFIYGAPTLRRTHSPMHKYSVCYAHILAYVHMNSIRLRACTQAQYSSTRSYKRARSTKDAGVGLSLWASIANVNGDKMMNLKPD